MTRPTSAAGLRGLLEVARGGYGAVLLVDPDLVAEPLLGRPLGGGEGAVARVLAVRHLVQALWSGARPTVAMLELGVATDLLPAASMVALGLADRGRRRAALTDAALATSFAVAGAGVVAAVVAASRAPDPTE
jgi:hypothetical protein